MGIDPFFTLALLVIALSLLVTLIVPIQSVIVLSRIDCPFSSVLTI